MRQTNSSGGPHPRIRRAYRALLRLLPFEFRAEFGRDMEAAFSEESADVRGRRSRVETLRFWLRTAKDFARTAPRQHWDVLRQDLRVGGRLLARNPGFAATAILTLALGIGGSTSIFSVVYAVVLRPLAFPESERVVRIGWVSEGRSPGTGMNPAAYTDFQAVRDHVRSFEMVGAMRYDSLSSEKGTLSVKMPNPGVPGGVGDTFVGPMMASASVFKMFGAATVLGRVPDEGDERPGAAPVVALGYGTWSSHYGRDASVIGRTVVRHLGGGRTKTMTIVGVLAPGFFGHSSTLSHVEVPAWGSLDPDVLRARDDRGREPLMMSVFGRLAPGTSLQTARAELAALSPHLAPGLPDVIASTRPSLQAERLRDQIAAQVRLPLLAFLGAVSCLLLLASVNVASLSLARALSRRQEFAARFALGARPLRVARQVFTESAIVAIAGGALGLGLASIVRRAFVAISPSMPRLEDSHIGVSSVLFALVGVLLATCIIGLVPALQSSRRSVVDGLKRAGGPLATASASSAPLAALVAAEVALVLVLLAGTGLLVNSFARLMLFDLGFEARSIVMLTLERPAAAAADRPRLLRAIDDEVVLRVSAIPGVSAAGLTGDDPFGPPYRYSVSVKIGDPASQATAALRVASPSAFEALRMRLAAGRWFTTADREGSAPVAIVNETMARRFWSGRSPLGDQIVWGRRTLQVVGISADVRERGARVEVMPTFYVSTMQVPPEPAMLVVRTNHGATAVERAIASELSRFGDRLTPHSPRRLEDLWWRQLADARFLTLVLSVFTTLGLAIALVGVYGVLRYLVTQRTREMGIRKALGATRFDLVSLVVGQALRFAAPGCVVGLIAAGAAGSALGALLFGITPTDPLTLAAATALLIAVVVVGAYFPARRASAVDPALSLRAD